MIFHRQFQAYHGRFWGVLLTLLAVPMLGGEAPLGGNTPSSSEKSSHSHSFLYAGKIQGSGIIDANGNGTWKTSSYNDVHLLDNKNFLVNVRSGVREITKDLAVVWEYMPGANVEVSSCARLPDGNTMLGLAKKPMPVIIEVDRDGKVKNEIVLQVPNQKEIHGLIGIVTYTPDDTYLVCTQFNGKIVREYNRAGQILHEAKLDASPFSARRLPKGHTLVACLSPCRMVEYDEAWKEVWTVKNEDLPSELGATAFTYAERLVDGNTVIANYLNKIDPAYETGASLFEITPDKKVVWTFRSKTIKGIVQFKILDDSRE